MGYGISVAQKSNYSNATAMSNHNALSAEASANDLSPQSEIDWANFDQYLEEEESEDKIFSFNENMQLLFVDLEEIYEQYNYATDVQKIEVRASCNTIVFSDDRLETLPTNSIYELDLKAYPIDTYQVYIVQSHQDKLVYQLYKKS